MEEVEEKFELVEEHNWQKVYDVVLLVIDCVGDGILRLAPSLHPHLSLHSHVLVSAAAAQQPAA